MTRSIPIHGGLWVVLAMLATMPNTAVADVTAGQVDDFNETEESWRNGLAPGTRIEDGGPDGDGDGYLQVVSGQAVPRLVIFNEFQWSGDFLAEGVTSITAMVRNESDDDIQLEVRLAFGNALGGPLNGGTWFASTNSISVPGSTPPDGDYNGNGVVDAPDYNVWRDTFGSTTELDADGNNNGMIDAPDYNVWRDDFGSTGGAPEWIAVEFPIGEADLTMTDGDGTESYADVMSNVMNMRILHSEQPAAIGDQVSAILGVDNITAVVAGGGAAVPEPGSLAIAGLASLLLAAARKRR